MDTGMEEKTIQELIEKGRAFLKSKAEEEESSDYLTDQEKKLP